MIARPVVSNASPIIALDEIGRLSLMQQLFGTVLIPPAVAVEVAPSVTLPPWIEQRALTQAIGPMVLRASLGPGESETISLCVGGKSWPSNPGRSPSAKTGACVEHTDNRNSRTFISRKET